MKRIFALLISAALLLTGSAFSEGTEPAPTAAFGGVQGMPFVVARLDDQLYYTMQYEAPSDGEAMPDALWVYKDGEAVKIADVSAGAAYVPMDGAIYYLDGEDSAILMALDVASGEVALAMDLGFQGALLASSMKGLLVRGLIEPGVFASRLYDAQSHALVPSDIDPTGEYRDFGSFETLLTAAGLRTRAGGSDAWQSVYSGEIAAQAAHGGALY